MSRILDERDRQSLENNINTIAATTSKNIADLNIELRKIELDLLAEDTKIARDLNNHKDNTSNPHKVTYTQVGADPTGSASQALSDAKKYTDNKISTLIDSAPDALNTLNELAAALGDDKDFAATMTTELGKKTNNTDFTAHTSNVSNPHSVTKAQVGLGNVPNVATNDQTPTYTQASTLATLVSGEKLSISFGKVMKAITDLISHIGNKSNPHGVTKAQVGLGSVDNTSDSNKPVSTAQATAIADAKKAGTDAQDNLEAHNVDVSAHEDIRNAIINTDKVFVAIYGETTFDEIKEAYDAEKIIICKKDDMFYQLYEFGDILVPIPGSDFAKTYLAAYFSAAYDKRIYCLICSDDNSTWTDKGFEHFEITSNKVSSISSSSTNIQYPSAAAVYMAIQAYEETDPTVPDWAKADTKPTYTASEVGALSKDTLPAITSEDEGKVLCVVNGAYNLVSIEDLIPSMDTGTTES